MKCKHSKNGYCYKNKSFIKFHCNGRKTNVRIFCFEGD